VVDTGFSGVVGYALHFIPPGFLPECPMTTPKYFQKISYSSKPQISFSASFIFFGLGLINIYLVSHWTNVCVLILDHTGIGKKHTSQGTMYNS